MVMRFSGVKFFVRSLSRNKLYSGITVFGFAMALTFVLLLGTYIRQELSVDDFHVNKDRIFMLSNDKGYGSSGPIGPMLQNQFPEIESFTRFMLNKEGLVQVSPTEKLRFTYAYVDPSFFKIFSFPLLDGIPEEVMRERYSAVVSRSFARKIFGNESPVGKEITIGQGVQVPVTGVMEDIPDDTHFERFDVAVNIAGLSAYWGWSGGEVLESIGISTFALYMLEKPGADLMSREADILACFQKNYPQYQMENAPKKVIIEPLKEIYFSQAGGWGKQNSKTLLGVLGAIAAVILLLAVINYINLSVAQGGMRAKEMSVKKLLGSSRRMLFSQYIGESVFLCTVALIIAAGFSLLAEPLFNRIMDTHCSIAGMISPWTVGIILGGIVLIGIVAGVVPAWVVTRFNAIEVMKGAFRKKNKGVYSKVLISFQYVVAITLIICTIVLVKQTHFMRNYDMGFDRENIARFSYVLDAGQKEALRNEVMQVAGVKDVAFACGDPLDGGSSQVFDSDGKQMSFKSFKVDSSFFRIMGIKLEPTGVPNIEGVPYSSWVMRGGKTEALQLRFQSVWLNQEAVRQLGVGELPLEFKQDGRMCPVMGVMDNFHTGGLSLHMVPLIISPIQAPETPWTMLVQMQGADQYATFNAVKEVYNKLSQGTPFESAFINDEIAQWYDRTERISEMIGNLCMLAILLSAMGILAMATYFIQQRIKEIGVRRVNGATVREVLRMLMNSFIKWIVIAFALACPLGYYAMDRWLAGFAYRTPIDWWVFVLSGGMALLVAGLMICWQSWKAATVNPVESLKSE